MNSQGIGTCKFEDLEPRLLMSRTPLTDDLMTSSELINAPPAASVTLSNMLDTSGDYHVYQFMAPARGKMIIELSSEDGQLDPYLELFKFNGRYMKSNDNYTRGTTDSRIRFSARPGWTYYIATSGADGTSGAYNLTVTSIPRDDKGNSFQEAAYMRLNRRTGTGRFGGTINYNTDVDMVAIEATMTGTMILDMAARGRNSDIACDIHAYDADGNLLTTSDVDGRKTLDVARGVTYYIKATSANSGEGRYLVSMDMEMPDLMALSELIDAPPADSVTLNHMLDILGDYHVYQFTTPATGKMIIDLSSEDGQLDPYLELFRSDGRRMKSSDNYTRGTTDSRILFGTRPGWTYYIATSSAEGTLGAYNLTVTSIPRDDKGNSFQEAAYMRLNRRTGTGRFGGIINYNTDVDMVTVEATMTGTMFLDMAARGRRSSVASDIYAYDSDGNLLTTSEVGGRKSFDVVEGARYYIKATSANSGEGRYLVHIDTEEKVLPPPSPPEDAPLPDAAIAAQVLSLESGLQLVVAGTEESDSITVSQTTGVITLSTPETTLSFNGFFTSVAIYGFGGQDAIRLDSSVFATSWTYAGDGDDTVFDNGPGTAMIIGGAGDDMLVTVGGGTDVLYGQDGLDSLWLDGSDYAPDVSGSESYAGSFHRIGSFYQPYTARTSSPLYIPLEIAGQDLPDPQITYYASGYANFSSQPVFVDGPQYDDIQQGAVGDCYFLASLASLADTDPHILSEMVAPLGDGTFAVRFFRGGRDVYVRLDGDLPINSAGYLAYAKTSDTGEIWVALGEKAYAFFRSSRYNSYAAIHGGWMEPVYEEVTGAQAVSMWVAGSADQLYNSFSINLSYGFAVTLGSYYYAGTPIVGSHAYVLKSVQTVGTEKYATLYNPWGVDGRGSDGNAYDGLVTISMSKLMQSFMAYSVCLA